MPKSKAVRSLSNTSALPDRYDQFFPDPCSKNEFFTEENLFELMEQGIQTCQSRSARPVPLPHERVGIKIAPMLFLERMKDRVELGLSLVTRDLDVS